MSKKTLSIICFICIIPILFLCINKISEEKVHEILHVEESKLEGNVVEIKSVYVGGTAYFKSATSGITSCVSENSTYVNAFVSGGECIIRGIAPTDNEVIVIAKDNDNQYTIKVSVIAKVGSNDGFESNTSSNIVFAGGLNINGSYTDFYDSNTVMSQLCTTYNITNEYGNETNYGNDIYVSSYSATEACGNANSKFAAICLDPSKAGPTSAGSTPTYKISSEINSKSLLGKVTSYINTEVINKKISINEFINNASNDWRIASNIAIRVIDIFENGGSFSTNDALVSHYYEYAKMADLSADNSSHKIKLGKSVSSSSVESKIEEILSNSLCTESIPSINKTIWNGCSSFGNQNKNNKIERIIDSSEVIWQPNLSTYSILYKGQLILPASVTGEVTFKPNCSNGFNCPNSIFTFAETLSDGRKKYNFNVTINGSVSASLPVTDTDRRNISIAVTAQGLNPLSDAYILKPTNGTNRQRLVLLNTASPTVYLYFSGTPNCNIDAPALNYRNCTASNCTSFKPDLFLKAGCCDLIPKDGSYDYAYKKACASSSCIYSTFQNACSANLNVGENTKYVIQEGVDANGEAKYSSCIIDVTKSDSDTKLDAAGNSLMVASFEDNPYCDISCKEDWEFSLGSFGAFTGENAIAAGTFFTLKNPLIVNGSRTCFTSFIDYNSILQQLTEHSKNIIDAFNSYVTAVANRAAIKVVAYTSEAQNLSIISRGNFSKTQDTYCSAYGTKEVQVGTKKVYKSMGRCECYCRRMGTPDAGMSSCTNGCIGDYAQEGELEQALETISCHVGTEPVYETRYFCSTIGSCPNFTFTTGRIGFDKYYYDATSFKGTSTAYVFINTKSGTTSGITIPGLSEFKKGVTHITKSSQNSELLSSSDGIVGSCPTKSLFSNITRSSITDYVYNRVGTQYETIIETSQNKVIYETQQIKTKSENMFACQHWQLYNAADEGNSEKAQNDILGANYMGLTLNADKWKKQYYPITSAFDPQIAYLYEEEEYMSMIGPNNLLVEDKEKNDIAAQCNPGEGCFDNSKSVNKGSSGSLSNTTDTCYTYNYKIELPDGTTKDASSEVCHNYVHAWYYNTVTPWAENSEAAKNYHADGNTSMQEDSHPVALCTILDKDLYESGKNGTIVIEKAPDKRFHKGKCIPNRVAYVKANYIKQTIKDGSIYKITGQWYTKDGEDTKSFSSDGTKEKAMTAVGDRDPANKSYWSPLGTAATFPVKISTRRNMYQYLFSFGYIGSFSNGSLGRIMGTSTSIIKLNNTACFYEVYEEICICCGDPIESTINTYTGISTKDYIKQNNISYIESNYTNISAIPTLGFYFSTISLNDLDTDTNRVLEDNWKISKYMINGYDNHTSRKGEDLVKDIKSVGENIYNLKPEYSFRLTPNAMIKIREYNNKYGYEIDLTTLKPYGLVSTEPLNSCFENVSNCDWGLNDTSKFDSGKYISFVHFGSKFLEGDLSSRNINTKDFWAPGANSLLNSNKVCEIFEDTYKNNVGQSNTKTALQDLVNNGCRWIDYIDIDTEQSTGSSKYYRLSFK